MLNSVLSAKGSISMETKTVLRGMQLRFCSGSSVSGSCNRACNSGQPFLGNGTCANSVNPDTVWPVVWQDIGGRIVCLFETLHNEHDNDLKRSSSRFKVPPCLKTCTKTNLPKKQPTIENWTENKTNSPLVKYNLDSLLSTQEGYIIKHDQEVLKNFDFKKNLSDYENGVWQNCSQKQIKKNLDYWKSIDASPYVLDIISSEHEIPFIEEPPCAKFENNKSAPDNSEFIKEALAGLVETGCVLEVPFSPKVINPLSVSTKNYMKRLILDLRYVNKFIWKEGIKFDD